MITDQILFLDREYRDRFQGIPTTVCMTPEQYADLIEELGVDHTSYYHGMRILVDEYTNDLCVDNE
jgi:hypothetical protein